MRTIAIILLGAGLVGAAETAKPPAEAPKTAVLSELQQAKVELALAKLQLLKAQETALNVEADSYITAACAAIGGKAGECSVIPPNQGQPRYSVALKPKEEVKK